MNDLERALVDIEAEAERGRREIKRERRRAGDQRPFAPAERQ
jgi:hypothetical protein